MSYSPTDSTQIEAMYQANKTSQHLVIRNRKYKFDFDCMKQVNVDSDYKRNVVREPSWEVVNKSIGAKFLCNNEVVINLKGPSNGVEKVKVQLEEKLKSLLFSKRIPYPPQATLALLSKLKEVSSKHLVTCTVVSSRESGEEASESIQLEGFEVSVMEARGDILELLMRQISTADEVLYILPSGTSCP